MDVKEVYTSGNYHLVAKLLDDVVKNSKTVDNDDVYLWGNAHYYLGHFHTVRDSKRIEYAAKASPEIALLLAKTRMRLEDWDGVVSSFIAFWRETANPYFVVTASPIAVRALVIQGKFQEAYDLAKDVNRFIVNFAIDEGFESGMSSVLLAWAAELSGQFTEAEKAYTEAVRNNEATESVFVGRSRVRNRLGNKEGAASDALAAFHLGGGIEEASPSSLVAIIYVYESVVTLAGEVRDLSTLSDLCLGRAKYGFWAFPANTEALWDYAAAVGVLQRRGIAGKCDVESESRAVALAVKGLKSEAKNLVTTGYWTDWIKEYL